MPQPVTLVTQSATLSDAPRLAPLKIYEVLVVIYIVMEAQLALVFIIGLCLCCERSDTSASATATASVQWEGNEEF